MPVPSLYKGKYRDKNDDFERIFEAANNALVQGKIKERFYGIFIDEVQIFKPEWYRFCFNLLKSKNADDHFFIIAGDKSQDIKNNIKHGKAPWQGGGDTYPEYRGKTLPIEINYRNSKPINDTIDNYVSAAKAMGAKLGVDLTSDQELFLRGTAFRNGNHPVLLELDDFSNEGEAKAICDSIKKLKKNNDISDVDIAIVLYNESAPFTSKGWKTHNYKLEPYIRQYFYKEKWTDPVILKFGQSEGATYGSRRGVSIISIEGSLGLDFRAIVLAGLRPLGTHENARAMSDFLNPNPDQQEGFKKNVNFLYTACTRAKDELIIILSDQKGENLYMDLLRESMRLESKNEDIR